MFIPLEEHEGFVSACTCEAERTLCFPKDCHSNNGKNRASIKKSDFIWDASWMRTYLFPFTLALQPWFCPHNSLKVLSVLKGSWCFEYFTEWFPFATAWTSEMWRVFLPLIFSHNLGSLFRRTINNMSGTLMKEHYTREARGVREHREWILSQGRRLRLGRCRQQCWAISCVMMGIELASIALMRQKFKGSAAPFLLSHMGQAIKSSSGL